MLSSKSCPFEDINILAFLILYHPSYFTFQFMANTSISNKHPYSQLSVSLMPHYIVLYFFLVRIAS